MNTTRAWGKEKSESPTGIEPLTPGRAVSPWATRTHGDPSSMQDACHTWTQLNGLVRLLSGTQIFSLPHVRVMLVSSLFTRLFLFFFFRRAPEISLKPEENRREELYYSDQYHSDPDAEEPLLSHKTNSPSYSAIWDYNFFSLLNSFQFCSHGLLSERIITRTSFCWVPWTNTYFMASRGVPETTFKRSKIVFNLSISVSNDF